MQKRIFSRTGILRMNHSILLDMDSLWQRFDCEEKAIAEGFDVVHFDDDMKLRRYYEFECQDELPTLREPLNKKPCILLRRALSAF